MPRRVDSRDVLDPNGRTRRAFAGCVVGRFRRLGPNAWDDYELLPAQEEPLRVAAGLMIQVEGGGARFRLRRRGEVVLVEWTPSQDERGAIAVAGRNLHAAFIEACVDDYASPSGFGLAAVIAKKLKQPD
jgi:hypothetical protein